VSAKTGQIVIIFVGAALVALVFVKLMYDMSNNMTEMNGHIGSLSRDVAAMNVSVELMATNVAYMSQSMLRIEANMQEMGHAITQGSEQFQKFQQWSPSEMLRQFVPDGGEDPRAR
jgi:NADH:ubiquinone oxidoreductase subunit 6 (subunit J)